MSIQYAGGSIINATMASPAGTRAELAQWIRDQLILAGWTSAGTATDYQLTSATTTGGNLACRVRSYDPGSGNCARLKFSNVAGSKTQAGDIFLLPAVGKSWRIIANKYQFFVFAGTGTPRELACGGVPFLPNFLQGVITEAIWGSSNALSDTDNTVRPSFRTSLIAGNTTQNANQPNMVVILNGTLAEFNNSTITVATGLLQLVSVAGAAQGYTATSSICRRWHDDSLQVMEPLIAWGANLNSDEAKIRGQLFDSVILSDLVAIDTTIALDGRTYWVVGGGVGAANSTSGYLPGSLAVAVT